jgi:hypothetical protein
MCGIIGTFKQCPMSIHILGDTNSSRICCLTRDKTSKLRGWRFNFFALFLLLFKISLPKLALDINLCGCIIFHPMLGEARIWVSEQLNIFNCGKKKWPTFNSGSQGTFKLDSSPFIVGASGSSSYFSCHATVGWLNSNFCVHTIGLSGELFTIDSTVNRLKASQ